MLEDENASEFLFHLADRGPDAAARQQTTWVHSECIKWISERLRVGM